MDSKGGSVEYSLMHPKREEGAQHAQRERVGFSQAKIALDLADSQSRFSSSLQHFAR